MSPRGPDELPALVAPIARAVGAPGLLLVGGAVRDLLLDRPVADWDLIVPDGDAGGAANAYARRSGGAPFALSHRHGAWRVVDAERTVDFAPLAPGGVEDDLRRRDVTLNAVAVRLDDGVVLDPLGGLDDLAEGRLVLCSDEALRDDPLRLLRIPRLAVDLRMRLDAAAEATCRRDAALATRASAERQLDELLRILGGRDPVDALLALERLGVLAAFLPEVAALRGVEQSAFHHLDVLEHTLHVIESTADIAGNVAHYFPDAAVAAAIEADLAEPVEASRDVRTALRVGALLHDIAKPQTRTDFGDGRVGFPGHARLGEEVADGILGRLAASRGMRRAVGLLVREHLRLGFLARDLPLPPRTVAEYVAATEPHVHATILVSLGDRLATRGPGTRQRVLRRHAAAAREMAAGYEAVRARLADPVVRGDELARALGLRPGPALGRLLAELRIEQAAGSVTTRAEAIAWARGRGGEDGISPSGRA